MTGILPMTVLTLAVATGGYLALGRAMGAHGRGLLWLVVAGLPMSAAVNLLVKAPLARAAASAAGVPREAALAQVPLGLALFAFMLAPVFEEAFKALPLSSPRVRSLLNESGAVWSGAAVGLGFGLGEIVFLGVALQGVPRYAGMPWYLFTGFFGERLAACLAHVCTAAVMYVLVSHGRWLVGYLSAVGMHAVTNVGAALVQERLVSGTVAALWLAGVVVAFVYVFERLPGAQTPPSSEVVYYRRDRPQAEEGTGGKA